MQSARKINGMPTMIMRTSTHTYSKYIILLPLLLLLIFTSECEFLSGTGLEPIRNNVLTTVIKAFLTILAIQPIGVKLMYISITAHRTNLVPLRAYIIIEQC